VLWDISEGGARLSVTDMARVPNEFLLVLERDAPRGTSCRVAWRRHDQIGLEFIDHADWKLHDLIRQKASGRPAISVLNNPYDLPRLTETGGTPASHAQG
jgi:hypothetical protein